MPSASLVLYITTLLEQAYAIGYHFPPPPAGIRSPGHHKALLVLGSTCACSTLWALHRYDGRSAVFATFSFFASVLCLAYLALFMWTSLTTKPRGFSVIFGKAQPEYVVTDGPYASIRHPTYVSYALSWTAAMLLMLGSRQMFGPLGVIALGCYVGSLFLFQQGAEQEEEEFRSDAKNEASQTNMRHL